jgi:nucleotide-binding universal stress UspA family protein
VTNSALASSRHDLRLKLFANIQGTVAMTENTHNGQKEYKVLVAVDFSESSAIALRTARLIMGRKPDQIIVLHVIDRKFIENCIENRIGTEGEIKKTLFLQAQQKLKDFLQAENMTGEHIKEIICDGIPFLEINKKAVEVGADMIIMGNRGNSGDMQTIFFGSTTERVLRFICRPVLCVPSAEDRK